MGDAGPCARLSSSLFFARVPVLLVNLPSMIWQGQDTRGLAPHGGMPPFSSTQHLSLVSLRLTWRKSPWKLLEPDHSLVCMLPPRQELQGDVDREANGFPSKTPLTFRESPLVSLPCLQPGNQWWVPGTAPWTFPSLNLLLPAVTLRSLRRQLRSPPCPYHPKDPQPNSTQFHPISSPETLSPCASDAFPVFRACLAENTLTEMPTGTPVPMGAPAPTATCPSHRR